jgi:hypothetical protein
MGIVPATRSALLGVEQVDLMPVLEASLSTYYDFLHFTPAGSRQVAEHAAVEVVDLHCAGVGRPAGPGGWGQYC